jgi:hypothetical protein
MEVAAMGLGARGLEQNVTPSIQQLVMAFE